MKRQFLKSFYIFKMWKTKLHDGWAAVGRKPGQAEGRSQRLLLATTCARRTQSPLLRWRIRNWCSPPPPRFMCAVQEETGMSSISSKRLSYCRRSVTYAMQASNKSDCCIVVWHHHPGLEREQIMQFWEGRGRRRRPWRTLQLEGFFMSFVVHHGDVVVTIECFVYIRS